MVFRQEIGSAVMLFGPVLPPEFWRALDLLRVERSTKARKAARITPEEIELLN
jgi:hypothetical protein